MDWFAACFLAQVVTLAADEMTSVYIFATHVATKSLVVLSIFYVITAVIKLGRTPGPMKLRTIVLRPPTPERLCEDL